MGVGKVPRKPLPGSPQSGRAGRGAPPLPRRGPSVDLFPVERPAEGPDVEIAGADFRRLVRQTVFATNKYGQRYAFDGALFVADGGRVKFVATDGRRLAVATAPLVAARSRGPKSFQVILPARELAVLAKD